MWQTFTGWLPDLKVGTIEIRDLVSLIVGGLGAFLAYLAIKLGKEQATIAKRQTELAEKQDLLMRRQLAQHAEPFITVRSQHQIDDEFTEAQFALQNIGDKTADECQWELLVSLDDHGIIAFVNQEDGSPLKEEFTSVDDRSYMVVKGHLPSRLFPRSEVNIARGRINRARRDSGRFEVRWRTTHDSGVSPNDGRPGLIEFEKAQDRGPFYNTEHYALVGTTDEF